MGSFISVSRGSDEPLKFLEIHYKGAADKNAGAPSNSCPFGFRRTLQLNGFCILFFPTQLPSLSSARESCVFVPCAITHPFADRRFHRRSTREELVLRPVLP